MQHLPKTEPGTVAICFVVAALQSVRARQLDADALLEQVGLSPGLLNVPQARVSVRQYGALWRLVALTLDDEFFGQDSRRMKAGSFAMMCHAVLNCRNLGQALERTLRFYGLVLDDISGQLERRGALATITLVDTGEVHSGAARHDGARHNGARHNGARHKVFAHEVLLMLLHGVSCWLVGRRIPILSARFSYPEPAHSAEYRFMYSINLSYLAPHTGITFDAEYLDLPIVQNERSIKEFLANAPENILTKYKNGSSLAARTRRRMRQSLPGALPEFERVAMEMNMTPVTLRRRLHEEGTSFQSIKDQLRRDLAISYLSDSTRSAIEVGLELGFSERSAFHRAFKKWTGASPGEFRRRMKP